MHLGQVCQSNQFGPAEGAHLKLNTGVQWSATYNEPFEKLAVDPWPLPHYSLSHQLLSPPDGR